MSNAKKSSKSSKSWFKSRISKAINDILRAECISHFYKGVSNYFYLILAKIEAIINRKSSFFVLTILKWCVKRILSLINSSKYGPQ
jgi:hypothetical protein